MSRAGAAVTSASRNVQQESDPQVHSSTEAEILFPSPALFPNSPGLLFTSQRYRVSPRPSPQPSAAQVSDLDVGRLGLVPTGLGSVSFRSSTLPLASQVSDLDVNVGRQGLVGIVLSGVSMSMDGSSISCTNIPPADVQGAVLKRCSVSCTSMTLLLGGTSQVALPDAETRSACLPDKVGTGKHVCSK